MNFKRSLEEIALQERVKAFMSGQDVTNLGIGELGGDMWVASTFVNLPEEKQARLDAFVKKLVDRGWWVMHWPIEFGGKDIPRSTWLAYVEAMAYHGAPVSSPGYQAVLIMNHGSKWQKEFFLPKNQEPPVNRLVV